MTTNRATYQALITEHTRRQVEQLYTAAVDHLRLLAEYGLTPDTCPVCRDCPDQLTRPTRFGH